jgi:hypothetical protein
VETNYGREQSNLFCKRKVNVFEKKKKQDETSMMSERYLRQEETGGKGQK